MELYTPVSVYIGHNMYIQASCSDERTYNESRTDVRRDIRSWEACVRDKAVVHRSKVVHNHVDSLSHTQT